MSPTCRASVPTLRTREKQRWFVHQLPEKSEGKEYAPRGVGRILWGKLLPRKRLAPCSFLLISLFLSYSMQERGIIIGKVLEEKGSGVRFVVPSLENPGQMHKHRLILLILWGIIPPLLPAEEWLVWTKSNFRYRDLLTTFVSAAIVPAFPSR